MTQYIQKWIQYRRLLFWRKKLRKAYVQKELIPFLEAEEHQAKLRYAKFCSKESDIKNDQTTQ